MGGKGSDSTVRQRRDTVTVVAPAGGARRGACNGTAGGGNACRGAAGGRNAVVRGINHPVVFALVGPRRWLQGNEDDARQLCLLHDIGEDFPRSQAAVYD